MKPKDIQYHIIRSLVWKLQRELVEEDIIKELKLDKLTKKDSVMELEKMLKEYTDHDGST